MKVTLPYQVVLLARSNDQQTPLTVLPHEVTILQAIHGEEKILFTDVEPPEGLREPHTLDTEDEYPRLQELYKQDLGGQNAVVSIWKDQKSFDADFEEDGEEAVETSKAAKGPTPPVSNPIKTAANTKALSEEELQHAELVAQAKELGIPANKNWSVAKLEKDIAAKKDENFKESLKNAEKKDESK